MDAESQAVVLMIKGTIASLPLVERMRAETAIEALREFERLYGDAAVMAIALRGAEMAAEAD